MLNHENTSVIRKLLETLVSKFGCIRSGEAREIHWGYRAGNAIITIKCQELTDGREDGNSPAELR